MQNNIFSKQIIKPILYCIKEFPNRNSFCIDDEYFTYQQLGEYISKIRTALREKNSIQPKVGLVVNSKLTLCVSLPWSNPETEDLVFKVSQLSGISEAVILKLSTPHFEPL